MRLVDDDDVDVPVGEIGEIVCRPDGPEPDVRGLLAPARGDASTVLRNLWFHTGDLGRLDEDGFLYFVDRKKDYLRRRGENISSFEMERTFLAHPDDRATSRCTRCRARSGEDDVKVTAVLQDGATLTEEELCRVVASTRSRTSRCRATSSSATTCPATRSAACSSTSCATRASPPATWDREAAGFTFERR